ncbi:MAG: histidine phosphatase family protein, partial [Planctomycetota bacterium]
LQSSHVKQDDPSRALSPATTPADGTRVWLARHALVHERFQKSAYGSQDVPLSEEGLRQTARLCEAFEGAQLTNVRASDLERARRLGQCISLRTETPFTLDPRLREINRGDWSGLKKSEFRERWMAAAEAWYEEPRTWRPEGGENDEEVEARVLPAFEESAQAAADSGIPALLACHYNVIRVLQTRLLGLTPLAGWRLPIDLARATLLEVRSGRWHVVCANVVERPDESQLA